MRRTKHRKALYAFLIILSIFCCFGFSACYSEEAPVISYKIEYYVNDTMYYTGRIKNGEMSIIPQDPEIEGYVFDGWFLDNNTWEKPLTIKALLDLPLSSSNSFKVYAKLIKNSCDLDSDGHSFIIIEEVKSTCTERGYIIEKCSKCEYEKNTVLEPMQHEYISEVVTSPQCTVEGVRKYTCTRANCNQSYTQPIAALQHNYKVEITTQPTCTTKGVKTYSCLRENCNHSYTESISELQHIFVSEETVKPCITEGVKTHTCSRENCSYSYTEILPALGYHDCDENGNCIRCLTQNVCSAGFASNGNVLTVYNGNSSNIIIPSMFNGKVITKLDSTFLENDSIESVYIPDTIVHIGASAFDGCTSLKNVRMSSNIKIIDSFAFTKTAITSIYIPKSVTNIKMYAFYDCLNLTNVYYEGTQMDWDAINIADKNSNLTSATLICNYISGNEALKAVPSKKLPVVAK